MTTLADRLAEALADQKISQSELARAIKITQGTISLILQGKTRQSKHLPEIARRLNVSYDWLIGKSADKLTGSAPYQAPVAAQVMLPVTLPSEPALERMFEGLLMALPEGAPRAEHARLLAKWLPIGLSQLRDLLPHDKTPSLPYAYLSDEHRQEPETASDAVLAIPDRAPR